jgi:hypothetical protein
MLGQLPISAMWYSRGKRAMRSEVSKQVGVCQNRAASSSQYGGSTLE